MASSIYIKLVIFGIQNHSVLVLLNDKKLLSGTFGEKKSLDETAKDIFFAITDTQIKDSYIEQLYTIEDEKKEKAVSVVYYVLLSDIAMRTTKTLQWENAEKIAKKNSEREIIHYALQRLQWKIEYTNVIYSFLPAIFTLSTLQETYETILGKELDKRNFRKKMFSLAFLEATGQKYVGTSRPAQMYRFKKRKPVIAKVF